MSGEDRDDRFAAFVINCQTELRHEGVSDRLPPKAGSEKKKVKI